MQNKGAAATFVQCTTYILGTRSAVLNVGASSTNDIICTTMKYIYSKKENMLQIRKKIDHLAATRPQPVPNRSAPIVGEPF